MTKNSNNIKLGTFVTVGTILLVLSLYFIGSKQHLFSDSVKVFAKFKNVDGLRTGNNVRYAGITIGTIDKIDIISDTVVVVALLIDQSSIRFIKKSSIAEIGSDGLMGNKLINIAVGNENAAGLIELDTLSSLTPIATDDMMRTLNHTNINVLDITTELKSISKKLNNSKAVWDLLADTSAAVQIKRSIANLEQLTGHSSDVVSDVQDLLNDIKNGKGAAGKLVADEKTAEDLEAIVVNLRNATDTAKLALHHMHEFMEDLNITPGPLGVLARDTVMAMDMQQIMRNLNESTAHLNENMIALQENFLFRRYFKKKEKAAKK